MFKIIDKTGQTAEAVVSTESVTGANPAANAEFSITVPAGERWLLKAVTVQLVQGLTQTPWPTLVIDDGTNVLWQGHAGSAAQAASTTAQVSWAPGSSLMISGATTGVVSQGNLPGDLVLEAGYRIRSVTTGIGAATDYGVPRATVQKLPAAI